MNRNQVRARIGRLAQGPPVVSDDPERWVQARRAWRYSPRVGRRQIDLLLRVRSAGDLPGMGRARLLAMGLPRDVVDQTLRRVHSISGWPIAWTATAQAYLGATRRADVAEDDPDTVWARSRAALAYHAAYWLAYDDEHVLRTLRAARSSLFARAAPLLLPSTQLVYVPWRASELPGYLRLPILSRDDGRPLPLVVILNGATTAKEETILWSDAFVGHGFAVLALDQPGTGEATEIGPPSGEHDDLLDGVRDLTASDPRLDGGRIALIGFSLGGAQAVRIAANDRRLLACVAVTPPYEPSAWLHAANPLMLDQLAGHLGGPYVVMELAEGFELPELMPRLRCPLLVLGAGRDLVVPPTESQRLAAAAGDLGTLLWYPRGGHGLFDIVPTWTADVAAWLGAILDDQDSVSPLRLESTPVDSESQQALERTVVAGLVETTSTVGAAQTAAPPEFEAASSVSADHVG